MTDKLRGGAIAGGTSLSLPITLRKTTDSTEQTGKVATDFTLSYLRQGGTRTAQAASDLAAVNSAFSAGGLKEMDATNMPGLYRVDWPDAAFASGVDWVKLAAKVAGCYLWEQTIPIAPAFPPVDIGKIAGDASVPTALLRSLQGYIIGTAATGTLTTLEFTSSLSGFADEALFNKLGVWLTGSLAQTGFRIRQNKQTNGRLITTPMAGSPANGDVFILY